MIKMVLIIGIIIFFNACGSTPTDNIKISEVTNTDKYRPKEKDLILYLPNSQNPLVLRTDFSSDSKWVSVCNMISNSGSALGFGPQVEYLSSHEFEGIKKRKILNRRKDYENSFIFIVDSITIHHDEHPILCIDLYDIPGDSFRVIPSQMWAIENNLTLANMDFKEFLNIVDKDGVFRGI